MKVLGNEVKLVPEIKAKAIALMRESPTRMCTGKMHEGGCYCVLGWIAKATQEVLGIGRFINNRFNSKYAHYAFSENEEYDPGTDQGACLMTTYIQRRIFTGLPDVFDSCDSPCIEIARIGDSRVLSLEEKIQWIEAKL